MRKGVGSHSFGDGMPYISVIISNGLNGLRLLKSTGGFGSTSYIVYTGSPCKIFIALSIFDFGIHPTSVVRYFELSVFFHISIFLYSISRSSLSIAISLMFLSIIFSILDVTSDMCWLKLSISIFNLSKTASNLVIPYFSTTLNILTSWGRALNSSSYPFNGSRADIAA